MKDTYSLKASDIKRKWYLIDAAGKTLGRIASKIAPILKGKHKADYSFNMDNGDYVVVVNADKMKLSGNKLSKKHYYYHTGYPGGIKAVKYNKLMQDKPEFVLQKAVKGMLSHNPLGRKHIAKLKVYAGGEHPHGANKPETLEV